MHGDVEERISPGLGKWCFPRLDGEGGASQAGGWGAVSWRDREKNPGELEPRGERARARKSGEQ